MQNVLRPMYHQFWDHTSVAITPLVFIVAEKQCRDIAEETNMRKPHPGLGSKISAWSTGEMMIIEANLHIDDTYVRGIERIANNSRYSVFFFFFFFFFFFCIYNLTPGLKFLDRLLMVVITQS